jgi:hypothetical protein
MPTKLRGTFSGPLDPDALETQVFAPVRSTDTSFSSVEKSGISIACGKCVQDE